MRRFYNHDDVEKLTYNAPNALPAATTVQGTDVRFPPSLPLGIRSREKRMFFDHLPLLRHEHTLGNANGNWQRWGGADDQRNVGGNVCVS